MVNWLIGDRLIAHRNACKNPKSEIRNNIEIQKSQNLKQINSLVRNFVIRICFGFRI